MFIAYTIKGYGPPFAGHKDNHAGLMTPAQIEGLRASLGIAEGAEWEPYGGLGDNAAAALRAFVEASPIARARQDASVIRSRFPIACRFPTGRRNPPRAPSGASCSILRNLAIRSPTGSSRPRPMSRYRPISVPS
jgi:pyruvate dehydrogenase E1 component